MADQIDWIIIKGFGDRNIGAIGFIGNKAAVVAAFYDDRDGNKDGKVSWGEAIAAKISPIKIKGRAVVEVAMAARLELDVVERDPSFPQEAIAAFQNFATGLIIDGIYASYLKFSVGQAAGAVAGRMVIGTAQQFMIRKGMEAAVKGLYDATVRP